MNVMNSLGEPKALRKPQCLHWQRETPHKYQPISTLSHWYKYIIEVFSLFQCITWYNQWYTNGFSAGPCFDSPAGEVPARRGWGRAGESSALLARKRCKTWLYMAILCYINTIIYTLEVASTIRANPHVSCSDAFRLLACPPAPTLCGETGAVPL